MFGFIPDVPRRELYPEAIHKLPTYQAADHHTSCIYTTVHAVAQTPRNREDPENKPLYKRRYINDKDDCTF